MIAEHEEPSFHSAKDFSLLGSVFIALLVVVGSRDFVTAQDDSLAAPQAEQPIAEPPRLPGEGEGEPISEPMEAWEQQTLRLELGLTFSRFEQQVQTDVDGEPVGPLISETAFGATIAATYKIWSVIRLGLFFQFDAGTRSATRFEGIGADTLPSLAPALGGDFFEVWLGPMVHIEWKGIFAELGWGALGIRNDEGRPDLLAEGEAEGAFSVTPTVAWVLALGGYVPLADNWELALRIQYRIRYYDTRGGREIDDVVHGTQNITPFVGVAWRPLD